MGVYINKLIPFKQKKSARYGTTFTKVSYLCGVD